MENQLNPVNSLPLPACQVCGRQDETLRAVSYPYIISIIFLTYWRAFTGIWCKRHRRRYLFLSSFISASLGWLGIPYGIFSTPITLFKLARGGYVDPLSNFQLLTALAEHKLLKSDPQDSIRCFEESLRYQDSPEVHQKLLRLYQRYGPATQPDSLATLIQFVAIPVLFVMVTIIGLIIGISDIVIVYLLSPFFGSTESIFVVILSWLPSALMMFLGLLFIRSRTEWALKQIHCTNQPLALGLAFFASVFGFYSMLEGRAIISALPSTFASYAFSMNDLWFGIRAILSYGGLLELINWVQIREPYAIIYLLIFSAGLFCSLSVGMATAREITSWRTRLVTLRKSIVVDSDGSSVLSWMWLTGIVSAAILFGVLSSPGKFINVAKANQHLEAGAFAMGNGDIEGALRELEQATSIWPQAVRGHSILGYIFLEQEKYDLALAEAEMALDLDPNSVLAHLVMAYARTYRLEMAQAIDNLKVVAASQPNWAMPHAYLALLYYQGDQTELMQQEIEMALANERGDGQASYLIGSYFFGIRDYAEAEKHLILATQQPSVNSGDYFLLARLYALQRKFDLAEAALKTAESLDAEELDLHLARASFWIQQEDLDRALSEVREILKSAPDNSDVHSDLSYIYFLQGRIDEASKEADLAIAANPYNAYAYIEQAFAYHAQGRLNEALEKAEQAVKYSPKADLGRYILAVCYMDSGRKQEAIIEFEKFLELYVERAYVAQYKENAEKYLVQLQK